MDISFENVDGVNGLLTIKMGKADYEEQVEKTLKDYCKKAKMPGFRPGKVPMSIVKKQFGNEAKAEEINKILSGKLYDYIKENKINMLGEPLVHEGQQAPDFANQEDFEFVFDIAVAPEFKVELNQDDTVDYYDIQVTDEQVDNQVKIAACWQNSTRTTSPRTAACRWRKPRSCRRTSRTRKWPKHSTAPK